MTEQNFVPLTRDMARTTAVGCTALLGLAPGLVGAAILFVSHRYYAGWDWEHDAGSLVIGAVFVLVGAAMLMLAVQQAFAIHAPETIVAIRPQVLVPGASAELRMVQPGPIRLRSLHARLVCDISARQASATSAGSYTTTRCPHQERIFAVEKTEVPAGGQFAQTVTFTVPADAQPSTDAAERRVTWRIEVWGRVRGGANFMHPFTVAVSG